MRCEAEVSRLYCVTPLWVPQHSAGSRRKPFHEIPVTKVLCSAGLRHCTPLPPGIGKRHKSMGAAAAEIFGVGTGEIYFTQNMSINLELFSGSPFYTQTLLEPSHEKKLI